MHIADDYIPVSLDTICVGTTVGCNLYLQNCFADAECKYILYCNGRSIISPHKIEELLNNRIQRLFIRKEDEKAYLQYLESRLKHIISDNKMHIKEKVRVVYNVAKNIMMDVFEDPRSGEQVERSKCWVSNTVEFILTNKASLPNMMNMISYDYYTYTHSVNVAVLGLLFSKYLDIKYEEMHALGTGLLLHDIGKTQIEAEIINKKERLNDEEFARIRMHVELGVDILRQIGGIDSMSFFPVMQHHEKGNGKGYPKGLKGEEIHEYGKIASIIDVYDALTTRRSYADARKPFSALKIMKEEMDGSFDGKLFREFILFLGSRGEKKS
ncbi:MAG: HD domain-containing protein [Candidatus Brocadia sp.]|jgi:putative nucleotidyltransferase with HDIG domain